jgi:hypothetical protein
MKVYGRWGVLTRVGAIYSFPSFFLVVGMFYGSLEGSG